MYGSDFSGVEDIDFGLTVLTGEAGERRALAQAVTRRFLTPRGGLPYAPGYGLDIRSFLVDTANPRMAEGLIAAEARKNSRIHRATATIAVDPDTQAWTVDLALVPVDAGPFRLTFLVTAETVSLI